MKIILSAILATFVLFLISIVMGNLLVLLIKKIWHDLKQGTD